ncbi:MAG: hypothetical protein ACI396_05135 [Acutalibacteraceae bacterium]
MKNEKTPLLRLTYQITPDEVKSALYLSRRLKNRKGKTIMWLVIAGILLVISVISVIFQPDYKIGYLTAAAMVIVMVMAVAVPKIEEKQMTSQAFNSLNAKTCAEFYDDFVRITVESTGADWSFSKDDISYIKSDSAVTIFQLKNSKTVAIPISAVDDENKAAFENAVLRLK